MPNNYSFYGTAGTSASGFTTALNYRVSYLLVQNTSANVLYITTDGKTAPVTTGGDGIFEIPANSSLVIPNQAPLWYQSASVIPKSSELTGPSGAVWTPNEIGKPYGGSLWGQTADPGTVINTIASAASTTFVVTAAG